LKKIASILLLAMLLFNWCGYRWVINYMQQQADATLEARLDNNDYDESQLIEIKVPINLPYQISQTAFERYDGEIEVDGIHYKYVKRKIANGELVLKCIPNQDRQRLQSAGADFFKLVNDLAQDQSSKKSNNNVIKSALGDYEEQLTTQIVALLSSIRVSYTAFQSSVVKDDFHSTPGQPPEA
jgi:hypothetical protein